MAFPTHRPRRLRSSPALRALVRETTLNPGDLVLPLFVRPGRDVSRPIASMPGHAQLSVDRLAGPAREARKLGIPAVILFGIPDRKDAKGTGAFARNGIVQQAVKRLKDAAPDLLVITDLCLCDYTDHGHCGVLARTTAPHPALSHRRGKNDALSHRRGNRHSSPLAAGEGKLSISPLPLGEGRVRGRSVAEVDNDATLEVLAKTAVSQAEAGADVVAPSAMMDGQVAAIRRALDGAALRDVPILAYAAKYASAFYGPFREAAESPPKFGDRSAYQMDPANAREALREARLDVEEGADMLMVKPALPYLDVLAAVKREFGLPTAAYNVSGEFAMLKAAAAKGWLDEKKATLEALTSIRRAGADFILTYHALEAARWLQG